MNNFFAYLIYCEKNKAFSEGRGLRKNVENIFFTFTPEKCGKNMALYPHHLIIKKRNVLMYHKAFLGTRKVQLW